MTILYENWSESQGDWRKSAIYMNVTSKSSTKRRGVRVWKTAAQIKEKWGQEAGAALITHKMSCPELRRTQVKDHWDAPPDNTNEDTWENTTVMIVRSWWTCITIMHILPLEHLTVQDLKLFLIWDSEEEVQEEEEEVAELYKACDDSDTTSSSDDTNSPVSVSSSDSKKNQKKKKHKSSKGKKKGSREKRENKGKKGKKAPCFFICTRVSNNLDH